MASKSFADIVNAISSLALPNTFDFVVALAKGGIVPGFLVSEKLKLPLNVIWINFRDQNNTISHPHPLLTKKIDFDFRNKNILLVDDRVKTGSTFKYAIDLMAKAKEIKTFAVNGKADYSLYDEDCFTFPWKNIQ